MGGNKKIKIKKETRDQKAIRILREKTNQKEIAYGVQLRLVKAKNDYIKNIINGRYFLARSNMIAVQIQNNDIKENIDGCTKSEEYFRAEYALQKMQAIVSMRNAHFAKQELFDDFKFKDEDIYAIEKDYYDGKVVRESYDDAYKKGNKAKFVQE